MNISFADPLDMQHVLFAELSRMFGQEVPLYDKSLAVNFHCNRALVDLLAIGFSGFSISDEELQATSRCCSGRWPPALPIGVGKI